MKFSIEVITVPVADVERALRFYVDQVGFVLDVDYSPNSAFRVVQLTPPGSNCSIRIGKAITEAPAGSLRNVYSSSRTSRPHAATCWNAAFRSVISDTRRRSPRGTAALPPGSIPHEGITPVSPTFRTRMAIAGLLQERGYRTD